MLNVSGQGGLGHCDLFRQSIPIEVALFLGSPVIL
jgi:hypothetical protein